MRSGGSPSISNTSSDGRSVNVHTPTRLSGSRSRSSKATSHSLTLGIKSRSPKVVAEDEQRRVDKGGVDPLSEPEPLDLCIDRVGGAHGALDHRTGQVLQIDGEAVPAEQSPPSAEGHALERVEDVTGDDVVEHLVHSFAAALQIGAELLRSEPGSVRRLLRLPRQSW